jgi:hypothetical protein
MSGLRDRDGPTHDERQKSGRINDASIWNRWIEENAGQIATKKGAASLGIRHEKAFLIEIGELRRKYKADQDP